MILAEILAKIKNLLLKVRFQPIRVYCLHHVSNQYCSEYMAANDWMDVDDFKQKVFLLYQSGTRFISLVDAYQHIKYDKFRLKNYSVLTFDDGYASLTEILPWLKQQNIPVTLFVNPDYADGNSFRETAKEKYLSRQELSDFNVEIGMHGLRHIDVSKLNRREFLDFVKQSLDATSNIVGYQPFWAYTWGRHTKMTDLLLKDMKITPVYVDGMKNYNDFSCIHRELLKC